VSVEEKVINHFIKKQLKKKNSNFTANANEFPEGRLLLIANYRHGRDSSTILVQKT
jgi:hypothetical protein